LVIYPFEHKFGFMGHSNQACSRPSRLLSNRNSASSVNSRRLPNLDFHIAGSHLSASSRFLPDFGQVAHASALPVFSDQQIDLPNIRARALPQQIEQQPWEKLWRNYIPLCSACYENGQRRRTTK
jgi:hypothetical protein